MILFNAAESTGSNVFMDNIQTVVPILGGFGALIWVAWRLFWKVDMRSQKEISAKDTLIKERDKAISDERALRFAAEDKAAKMEIANDRLTEQIKNLTTQIKGLKEELERLREQLSESSLIPGSLEE